MDVEVGRKQMAKKRNKKVILIVVFIGLILAMIFLKTNENDEKYMEEYLNSTYYDYVENPDNYTVTQGEIIEQSHVDVGDEISFFGEREWLIEVKLSDGTVVETTVLRAKEDNAGDVIDIAYKNSDRDTLIKYMDATQVKYVEAFTTLDSNSILKNIVIVLMFVTVVLFVLCIIKDRANKGNS